MGTNSTSRIASSTIVLIEPRTLYRDSFVRCLASEPGITIQAISNVDQLADLARDNKFALILLSVAEAPSSGGLRAQVMRVEEISGGVPIVVLSGGEAPQDVIDAFEAGAEGYISTHMTLEVAVAAMRFVAAGGSFAPAAPLMRAAQQRSVPSIDAKDKAQAMFTARQAAVVEALRKGMANKTIAYELNLCESTVKVHVRKIMRKLNATNRTQAAFLANELKGRQLS